MAGQQPQPQSQAAPASAKPLQDRALVWTTDFLTSPVGLALTIGVLFYYQLETLALRPNFIKALAYGANDPDMQYKLGAFYYHGMEGLSEDHGKAQAWFTAAAENGHDEAALHLGYMHYKGYGTNTSKEASHKWLSASAKKNNTEAAYRLGYLYYTGEGVGRNYQLAARQFRSAAERQHAGAAAMLGFMYHKGRGLPTHNKLAMLWFRRAAEMGDSRAMVNLGVMNFRGKGTRKDFVLAYMWFGLAHQLGDQETSYNGLDYMNRLVAKGKISPEEITEAVDLGQEWAEKHGLTDQQHGGYQANPPTTVRPALPHYELRTEMHYVPHCVPHCDSSVV
jgi:TPR repeat protein